MQQVGKNTCQSVASDRLQKPVDNAGPTKAWKRGKEKSITRQTWAKQERFLRKEKGLAKRARREKINKSSAKKYVRKGRLKGGGKAM